MPHRIHPKRTALKVLRALEDASEASEGRMMGFTLGLDDWCIGENAFRVDEYPSGEMDASFISELSSGRHRLEYIVQLCATLRKSATELLTIHDRALKPIVSKLSKGVAKLPDELLELIFKFATHDEHEGTRHAQWLSQVSQRFRRIALGDRTLWSIQFQCYDFMTPTDIARNVTRCGFGTDLRIVVNSDFDSDFASAKHFIYPCAKEARRWKSLTLIGDGVEVNYRRFSVGGALGELMDEIKLDLPRLHELCLVERRRNESGELSWYNTDADFLLENFWTTPNLRILRCAEYIPPPVLQFESITSFTLSVTLLPGSSVDQFTCLCTFLSDRRNLLEMDLDFINLDREESGFGDNITISDALSFPSLTSLRLSLSNFDLPKDICWMPAPFVKALSMPNLERFWLSTDLVYFPPELIPDPLLHPRITTLTAEFPRLRPRIAELWQREDQTLLIPLQKIPNVTSLGVTTSRNSISFSGPQNHVEYRSFEERGLRELCLRSCENMDFEGLQQTVRSLKGINAWDTLERVAVQTCDLLEYDEAVEVLGKEKLRFSRS